MTGKFNHDFHNHNFHWLLMEASRTRNDEHLVNPKAGFSPRLHAQIIWGSIGYDLSEHTSIWLGYRHNWEFGLNGTYSSISEPYQQFVWTNHIGGGFIAIIRNRLREQIVVSSSSANAVGDTGLLTRQLFGINHLIPGIDNLSAYLSGEVFFYLTNFGQNKIGFNQNRAAVGLSYEATRHFKLKLGY